jgi:hypothetical protein
MATSAGEARAALVALTDLSKREMADLWQELSRLPAEGVRDALIDVLPAIVEEYGSAAGALAADWYDNLRDEADTKRAFTAEPAELPDRGRTDALARWGVEPLFGANPDGSAALTLITGGLQRIIADAHRMTVVDNSIRDPDASGWRRVGVGDNCGFCRMLIDRGHVYTESSVTFRSHDHCNCAASPEWAGNVVKVSREPFRQSQKTRSDATKAKDNARARAYIADKFGG